MAAMGIKFTGEIGLTPVPGPTDKELEVLRAVVDEAKKAGVIVQVHAVSSTAMMAAGWDGAPTRDAPGFPRTRWTVRAEGLRGLP